MKKRESIVQNIEDIELKIQSINEEYKEKIKKIEQSRNKKLSGYKEKLKYLNSKLNEIDNKEKMSLVLDLPIEELKKLIKESKIKIKLEEESKEEIISNLTYERKDEINEK